MTGLRAVLVLLCVALSAAQILPQCPVGVVPLIAMCNPSVDGACEFCTSGGTAQLLECREFCLSPTQCFGFRWQVMSDPPYLHECLDPVPEGECPTTLQSFLTAQTCNRVGQDCYLNTCGRGDDVGAAGLKLCTCTTSEAFGVEIDTWDCETPLNCRNCPQRNGGDVGFTQDISGSKCDEVGLICPADCGSGRDAEYSCICLCPKADGNCVIGDFEWSCVETDCFTESCSVLRGNPNDCEDFFQPNVLFTVDSGASSGPVGRGNVEVYLRLRDDHPNLLFSSGTFTAKYGAFDCPLQVNRIGDVSMSSNNLRILETANGDNCLNGTLQVTVTPLPGRSIAGRTDTFHQTVQLQCIGWRELANDSFPFVGPASFQPNLLSIQGMQVAFSAYGTNRFATTDGTDTTIRGASFGANLAHRLEPCCSSDAGCDDGDPCTANACNPNTFRCTSSCVAAPGCPQCDPFGN